MSGLVLLAISSLWLFFIPAPGVGTDEDPPDRLPAGEAGRAGKDSTKQIEDLIEQLGNNDWHIREDATQRLIKLGKPALPAIKKALKHPDPEVRLRARLIFKHLKWGINLELREKIGDLMDNYEASNKRTRRRIIQQLVAYEELAAPVFFHILIYEKDDSLGQSVFGKVQRFLDKPEIAQRAKVILGEASSFWALRTLGYLAEREKDVAQTIRYYETALQIKPGERNLIAQLKKLYEQTEKWEQAIALYQKLIKLNAEESDYYFDLGLMYKKKGESEQARIIWNKILELPEVKGTDYYRLVNLYDNQGLFEEAIKVCNAGLKCFPEDTSLRYRLALLYKQTDKVNDAIGLFERILSKPIKSRQVTVNALEELGKCYYEKGKKDKAKESWKKITEVPEGKSLHSWHLQRQQLIFLKYQMVDEANVIIENLLKKYSDDKELLFTLFLYAGRIAEAKDEVMPALDYYLKAKHVAVIKPEKADMMDEYIILLQSSTNDNRLLKSFVEKINPDTDVEIETKEVKEQHKISDLILLARLYQSQGQYQNAAEVMERVLKLKPKTPETLYYLIDLYLQAGDATNAHKMCEHLREISPKDVRAYYLSGMVHQKAGNEKKQNECLEKVRELTKIKPEEVHLQLGQFLKKRGELEWARTELETVLAKPPHDSIYDANACEILTYFAQEKEDYETALNYTRKERPVILPQNVCVMSDLDTFFRETHFGIPRYCKMDFFDSNLHWLEGKTLHKKGKIEQGNQSLSRALEIYPGNVTAFEEIAELAHQNKFPQADFKRFTKTIIKHYQHKIVMEPFSSIHYYHLASVYLALGGDPVVAPPAFRPLGRDSPSAVGEAGLWRQTRLRRDEAISLIKEALLLNPAVLEYQVTLARLYAKKKLYQEAIAIIKLLVNLRPYEKGYKELLDEFTNPSEKSDESGR